jgi:hypothetical protein
MHIGYPFTTDQGKHLFVVVECSFQVFKFIVRHAVPPVVSTEDKTAKVKV